MDSGEVDELVETVARRLGRNVVLDDPESRLLAYSTISDSIDRARRYHLLMKISVPEAQPRQAEANSRVAPFRLPSEPAEEFFGRLGVPLLEDRQHVGTLWVQAESYEDTLDEPTESLPAVRGHLNRLTAHLAEELSGSQRARAVDQVFAKMLREGDGEGADEVLARRVEGARSAVVLLPTPPAGGASADAEHQDHHWPEPEVRQRILTRLLFTLSAGLRTDFAAGADTDHAVLFVPASGASTVAHPQPGARPIEPSAALLKRARELATLELPSARIGLGVSEERDSGTDPVRAHRQALASAQAQAVDPGFSPGDAIAWDELGIYRYLAESDGASTLLLGRLARLLKSPDGEVLTDTLEAILDSSKPRSELARKLHLHRGTLYNRLARIERTLGADPMRPSIRLELHAALKARRWARRHRLDGS